MAELPEDTQLVYVNWVRLNAGPFDLAIDFGYQTSPGPPDDYPVRVVMAWEHVQVLSQLLNENINAYEEQAGEIRNLRAAPGVEVVEDVNDD